MTIDAAQIELWKALSTGGGSGLSNLGDGLAGLTRQLSSSSGINDALNAALAQGPRTTLSSPLATSGLGGLASAVPGIGGGFGGLLGLSPIAAGLRALFGGDSQPVLPALTKYEAPDPVSLSLGLSDNGRNVAAASYGQNGASRVASAITVNVNAIDSKSFSDHSETIARVVRDAMLNSGALTDVVSEI